MTIESLTNDEGEVATTPQNKRFNVQEQSLCTCVLNFDTFLCRPLQNNNVVVSFCLERQWTAPEMSVHCIGAAGVDYDYRAQFLSGSFCHSFCIYMYAVGSEGTEVLSCHSCSLLASALLTPVRMTRRHSLRSAAAASHKSSVISADFMSLFHTSL